MMKTIALLLFAFAAAAYGATSEIDHRIIGGGVAADGKYPFQVALRYQSTHICGSTILNTLTVLTAAHCVDPFTVEGKFYILAGTNNVSETGFKSNVLRKQVHESYNPSIITYDIALLTLVDEIVFSDKIQPVTLEIQDVRFLDPVVIIGWGITSFPSNQPQDLLMEANVTVIDRAVCRTMMATYGDFPVYSGNICLMPPGPGTGACNGDSGGAALRYGKQIGIASWVAKCALGVPDVYVNVPYFYTWIYLHTKGNVNKK